MVQWDGIVPLDNGRLENLKDAHARLYARHKQLSQQAAQLERDNSICMGELARHRNRSQANVKPTIVHRRVTRPSLLLDHRLTNGLRVCLTSRHLIVACRAPGSSDFGIEFWEIEDLAHSRFLRLHNAPIQDIAASPLDQQTFATVSLDKQVIVTSLRSGQSTFECMLPVALWSCAWIEHTTVAAGGDSGRFFVVDGRGQIVIDLSLGVPGPVLSTCRLNDYLVIAGAQQKSRLFNVRARKFSDSELPGARTIRGCADGSFIQIAKNGKYVTAELGRLEKNDGIKIDKTVLLVDHDLLARPGIAKVGAETYYGIPDTERMTFALRRLSNPHFDFWNDWSGLFIDSSHPSRVLDVGINKTLDFIVACLSAELLRVYALPIE
jgi:WD40 repeat protein